MTKYSMTVGVHEELHRRFAAACKAEGVSISTGFEIAMECWVLDDMKLPHGACLNELKVCFYVDRDVAMSFKAAANETSRTQTEMANALMYGALQDGFGAPIRRAQKKATAA